MNEKNLESVATGFFASMPSEKLMTVGGIGFFLAFGLIWNDSENTTAPMTLGAVAIVILLMGFYGTVVRAKRTQELRMAELKHESRSDARKDIIPSGKTIALCSLVTVPMTQMEVANLVFEPDDDLSHDNAVRRVKLARVIDAGIPLGLIVELPNGKYIARSHYPPSEETTYEGV